ncbi:MAG: hypothetical protein KC621_32390 [Myxococcales bacterium]|nr:hypothetical protein [Myxococcales bacterium]
MIHPTALVAPGARLGADVTVGPFTVIHDDVDIGAGSVIGSHCEIGVPTPLAEGARLVIGEGALIRSHSVFYAGSTIGAGLRTGHRVTVREKLVAGVGLQIGTLSDFQGHAVIGDHVRTHSNVHIGQKTRIGHYCWIFPYTVFTNDPHPPSEALVGAVMEDHAVVTTMCVVLPGVVVGARSLVGAHSLVVKDVPPDTIVGGSPAKVMGATSKVKHRVDGAPAYPWMRHFHRGYPAEAVAEWVRLYGNTDPSEA